MRLSTATAIQRREKNLMRALEKEANSKSSGSLSRVALFGVHRREKYGKGKAASSNNNFEKLFS